MPVNSFLFRHAFIYIHFPVHCEPPLSAERKIRRNCRHKFYPQPFLIPVFNFSHKRPMFAFTGESGYTLGSPRKIAHKGTHAETGGVLGGGAITTLRAFRTFTNIPGPGIRTANFAALGSWPGGALEERRKPSGQRCAYACRCPEGVAAPLGCVIFLQFGDVAVFSLCAQYFLNVRGGGGITTLGAFHTVRKPCVAVA